VSTTRTTLMIDQIVGAIAKSDGDDVRVDPACYRKLALAAFKPLVKPTEAMIGLLRSMACSRVFTRVIAALRCTSRIRMWTPPALSCASTSASQLAVRDRRCKPAVSQRLRLRSW
jgi:hypothetical protein